MPFFAPVTNAIFFDEVCVFVSLLRDFSLKQVFRNPSDLEFASIVNASTSGSRGTPGRWVCIVEPKRPSETIARTACPFRRRRTHSDLAPRFSQSAIGIGAEYNIQTIHTGPHIRKCKAIALFASKVVNCIFVKEPVFFPRASIKISPNAAALAAVGWAGGLEDQDSGGPPNSLTNVGGKKRGVFYKASYIKVGDVQYRPGPFPSYLVHLNRKIGQTRQSFYAEVLENGRIVRPVPVSAPVVRRSREPERANPEEKLGGAEEKKKSGSAEEKTFELA
jgi:hypothetical protein